MIVIFLCVLIYSLNKKQRKSNRRKEFDAVESFFLGNHLYLLQQQVNWDRFIEVHSKTPTFRRHIRMDYESFLKLLGTDITNNNKKQQRCPVQKQQSNNNIGQHQRRHSPVPLTAVTSGKQQH
jgi:hypothetical protein